ncbi:Hypothetical protein DEACI_2786 [Acididesulfobacillus acetoxydans]|uniref:Uncharacterized protein n=1 Tax=Acididesulfobacillus acetoxydans TaxID=1561005 RepID=A0A8S0WPR5_9FIRM|nr:Hypothetical protein DEACI_2786 [Acididesulfobacillus acetoxydans]CEJ08043.1 Hypothetical protein DEACI_2518 [Acididesulfobacillus acetoxydans]
MDIRAALPKIISSESYFFSHLRNLDAGVRNGPLSRPFRAEIIANKILSRSSSETPTFTSRSGSLHSASLKVDSSLQRDSVRQRLSAFGESVH